MKIGSAAWARKTAARRGKGKYRYAGMYKGSVRDARKGTPAPVRAKRARVSMAEAERKRPQTLRKRAAKEFHQERTREVYKGLARDINRVQAGKDPIKYKRLATQMPATPKVEKALKVGVKTGEKQKPVGVYMRRSRDLIDFKDTKKALKAQGKNRQDNPKAFQRELKARLDKRAKRQKQKKTDQKHTINARARVMAGKSAGPGKGKSGDGPDYSGGALSDAWQFLTKTNIPGTKALGELDNKIFESKNPLVRVAANALPGGIVAHEARKFFGMNDGISPLEAAAAFPVGKGAQVAVKGFQAVKAGAKAVEAGSEAATVAKAGARAAGKAGAKSEARSAAAKKAAQTKRNEAAARKVRAKPQKATKGGRARGSITRIRAEKAKEAAAAERARIRGRKVETERAGSATATKPKPKAKKEPKTVVGKTKAKVTESKPVKTVTESKPAKTIKEQRQGKELTAEELANASKRQKYLHWKATSPTLKKYRTARKWGRRGFTGYLAGATIANEAGADVPGGNIVKGTVAAIDSPHELVQTGKTTLRVVPALFTGAFSDFVLNPAKTVERGLRDGMAAAGLPGGKDYSSKEIFDPVKLTYDHNMEFLKTMVDVYAEGSPEKIRDFTKTDMGLWGAAMFAPHIIPQARSDYITVVRSPARAKAAAKRARIREMSAESKDARIQAAGPAIKDRNTGEEFVFQGLGKRINRRKDIRETARLTARADAEKGFAEAQALGPKVGRRPGMLKSIRKSGLTGKKIRDANMGVDAADALVTVLAYGLERDPATLARQIRDIRKSNIPGVHYDAKKTTGVTDYHNLAFLEKHLDEITSDKNFWDAVDEARVQQRDVTTSEHKAYRLIGDTYGIKPPERRIEEMLDGKGKEKKADDFRRQRARASKKLAEARRMPAGSKRDIAEKRALEAVKRSRQYEVVRAKAYNDYLAEVRAVAEKKGYRDPVYVSARDVRKGELRPEDQMNPFGGRTSFRTHKFENKVVADRSFQTFLRDSIKTPRTKQVLHKMMREFSDTFAVVDKTGKFSRREFTMAELPDVAERLDLNLDEYIVMDSQQYKQAILDYGQNKDVEMAAQELLQQFDGAEVGSLREAASQNRAKIAEILTNESRVGHKYMIVPRAAKDELRSQLDPRTGNANDVLATPGRVMSRLLLGTSITWAASQVVADAIPLLATTKNPIDLARAIKAATKEWDSLTPKEKLAIRSTVGESVGVNGYPLSQGVGGEKFIPALRRKQTETANIHQATTDFWAMSDGGSAQAGRFLIEAAKGINSFEKARSGKYRQIAAIAMVNGEVERAMAGLGNALKLQREASLVMKDMTPLERTSYMATHHGRALERATNELMGNWRAMTSTEQKVAPWLIFYPFLRFSMRWSFHTFPKNHPMRASIVAFLGVQHVNELDHILGGPPGFFQAWATGIIHNSPTNWSGVELQRIAPASNVFVESLGDSQTNSVVPVRAFNPFYGPLAAGLLFGVDPMTGRQIEGDRTDWAKQAVANLVGGITPVRFFDYRKNDNLRQHRASGEMPIIGRREEQSWIGQIFATLNPDKNKRSFVFPFTPHKGANFTELQRASRLVDQMFSAPDQGKLQDVVRRYGEKSPQYRAELQKLQDSKKASAELKKLAKSLGINPEGSKQNQRAYNISQRDIYQVGGKYSEAAKGVDSTSRGLGGGKGLSSHGL